ncbi:damage-inducible protein DinB [Tardiphaga alba]|uniref:Damage-inducible protein DinB n=1 Tax=Tardiphaga alba TaxID=340268 RepID=A0ABX8A3K4_9BRAD|nr:DinB family protein [Tardiphaga alba]QUS37907.1 damage-inducible protein DinB [Tardiphaga alba]
MSLLAQYQTFGRYNRWANGLLYDAASGLPDEQYRADRGVFFKSLHGTLNHLLVTDRIWLKRFTGTGEAADRLDAILHDDLATLRLAREAEDDRIVTFVDALDEAKIAGTIKFRRVSTPEEFEEPLLPLLAHWFNHQTHHRGQAHAILTGLNGKAPELDLLFFQRLVAKASV